MGLVAIKVYLWKMHRSIRRACAEVEPFENSVELNDGNDTLLVVVRIVRVKGSLGSAQNQKEKRFIASLICMSRSSTR